VALFSNNCGNLPGSRDIFIGIFFQICDKFELLNSQKYCGNINMVWWEIIHEFYWKFLSLSGGKKILQSG